MKPVLITTKYQGVFAGWVPDDQDMLPKSLPLKEARMVIYWGTTRGVMELAETGPTSKTKASAKADAEMLHGITGVFAITDEAWKKWQKT